MDTRNGIFGPVLRLLERLINTLREQKRRKKRIQEEKEKKFKILRDLDFELKLEDLSLRKKRNEFIKKTFHETNPLQHYS